MPAKGAIVKEQLMKQLLDTFPGSFSPDGKVIHVDMIENGSPVQIKIALTAVKSPISNSPKTEVINEEQYIITSEEQAELEATIKEMGVEF